MPRSTLATIATWPLLELRPRANTATAPGTGALDLPHDRNDRASAEPVPSRPASASAALTLRAQISAPRMNFEGIETTAATAVSTILAGSLLAAAFGAGLAGRWCAWRLTRRIGAADGSAQWFETACRSKAGADAI